MTRKASCCCGRSSIHVEGEPSLNGICHCDNCKRRTGSAFGWSAYFRDGQVVQKSGELKLYEIHSAQHQQRWFCGCCGTTLFWKASALPEHTGIAGGCFTEMPLPEPMLSASNDGKCAWLTLPAAWQISP
jgi:hypothetical protein